MNRKYLAIGIGIVTIVGVAGAAYWFLNSQNCADIAFYTEELSRDEVKQLLDEGSVTRVDLYYAEPEGRFLFKEVAIDSNRQKADRCSHTTYLYSSADEMRQLLQECGAACNDIIVREK